MWLLVASILPLIAAASDCTGNVCDTKQVELNLLHTEKVHPAVKFLNEKTKAQSAKFRSLSGRNIDVWYDDGHGGSEQAHLTPGMESTTNTYEGHSFFSTVQGNKSHVLNRFTIKKDQVLYSITDDEVPGAAEFVERSRKEEAFNAEYANRTGIPWRHYFGPEGPRGPPIFFMWPAQQVGDIHRVTTSQGYWKCSTSKEECQTKGSMKLLLEVVSTHPKVFIIDNFLASEEADYIMNVSRPHVARSRVGNKDGGGTRDSSTRTSLNTWLKRVSHDLIDTLYRRASDVIRIDESLLTDVTNAEDIQVVNYANGQRYDSHHDWGVSGKPASRYLTLLLYLTDQVNPYAGGETSFPKGNNGLGFKVKPRKGMAVLFYNLLEDGNGDDLALHAALPVVEGEKWLANFWVWDPIKR